MRAAQIPGNLLFAQAFSDNVAIPLYSAACSGGNRPLIPGVSGRPFRAKAATLPLGGQAGGSTLAGWVVSCQCAAGFAHAVSAQVEAVGVVNEAVENRVSEGGIGQVVMPRAGGKLVGDERALCCIPVVEEFEEVSTVGVG